MQRQDALLSNEVFVINPTNMTDYESCILFHTLRRRTNEIGQYYPAYTSMSIPVEIVQGIYANLPQLPSLLQLSHEVIKRDCNSDSTEFRYEILGNTIGKGSYGKIYEVLGTLMPYQDHLILKNHNKRVAKIMIVDSDYVDELKKFVTNEYGLAKRSTDLRVKAPTFFTSHAVKQARSNMVMQYIPGDNLENIIARDMKETKKTSLMPTDTRINMVIALAKAIDKVHFWKIIHSDVKSANYIVLLNGRIKVVAIDFGGSVDIDNKDPAINFNYTDIYAAPEILRRNISTIFSDVYGIGKIILEIFRADDHPANKIIDKRNKKNQEHELTPDEIATYRDMYDKKIKQVADNCEFSHVFSKIPDLDKSHKKRILNLIKKKCSPNLSERGFISEIIETFEQISLERILKKLNKKKTNRNFDKLAYNRNKEELIMAHKAGVLLRMTLSMFIKENDIAFTYDELDNLKKTIIHEINFLKNIQSKQAIELFIERLDVMAFLGLSRVDEIIAKASGIIDEFTHYIHQLIRIKTRCETALARAHELILDDSPKHLQIKVTITSLEKTNNNIQLLLNKRNKSLTIDNLVLFNLKFAKKLSTLNSRLEVDIALLQELSKHQTVSWSSRVLSLFSPELLLPEFSTESKETDKRPSPL